MFNQLVCRILMPLVVVGLVANAWVATAWADDVGDAKVGDTLEVRVNNEWRTCKVISVSRAGRQIRVKVDGTGQILLYPSSRFRLPEGGQGETPADEPMPKSTDSKSTSPADEFRTWTDATGKFKIEARFDGLENDVVKLVRKDGTRISVPLAKLSDADQEVAKLRDAMQSAPAADNPFKVEGSPAPMPADSGSDAGGSAAPRASGSTISLRPGGRVPVEIPSTVVPFDTKSARQVIPTRPSKSTYQPDLITAREINDGAIGLPGKVDFFEKITTFAVDPESLVAAVSRNADFGKRKGFCEIDLVDLGSASLLNTLEVSVNANALDVIASGNTIRFVTQSGDAKRLDVWERNESGLTHLAGWMPYGEKKIAFARFASPDTLLTSGENQLVSWNAATGKPNYVLKIKGGPYAFSPGRKYLVTQHDLGVAVIETQTAKIAAVIDDSTAGMNAICFSPDGTRLATMTPFRQLKIWSIDSGAMLDDVSLATQFTQSLAWPEENHLLISEQYLYDIERRIVLWQYKGPSNEKKLTQVQDNQFIYIANSSDNRGLFKAVVPHEQAVTFAQQLDPAELLALKPGAKASIRLETIYTPGDNKKVYDALAQKLQENGVEVVQSGGLVFVGTAKKGKTQEVTYRTTFTGEQTTRNITPLLYSLTLYEGQDNIWSTSGSGGPGFIISRRQNESLDDAIRRLSQPSPSFFEGLKMPKLLARQAPGKVAYGASEMAFGGMKPSQPDARQ